jgi:hypothetical protein
MNKPLSLTCALAVGFCLSAAWPAHAQEARGTILGRAADESGAALPGVTVEVVNVKTGVVVSTQTNQQGNYQVPLLNAGTYKVTFSLTGFNTQVRDEIALRVADLLSLDAVMTIGAISESVTVTAAAAPLETASASLGQVVDLKRIEELPMREGNPMELVVLAPGIANTTDLRFRKSGMTHSQSQFDADGTGEKRSDFAIDGIPNSSSFGGNQGVTVAYAPPAVSVEEFRVQTTTYDASLGNTPGAVVNVVTKSGTNRYRGDSQYKFRSSDLDGKSVFDERAGFPKTRSRATSSPPTASTPWPGRSWPTGACPTCRARQISGRTSKCPTSSRSRPTTPSPRASITTSQRTTGRMGGRAGRGGTTRRTTSTATRPPGSPSSVTTACSPSTTRWCSAATRS